jgi:hypothetical protein
MKALELQVCFFKKDARGLFAAAKNLFYRSLGGKVSISYLSNYICEK